MNKESNLKQRILHEVRVYLTYALFLTLFFCAFSTYRRLILGEYAISYIHYGYSFVESLILAKIILIGEKLKLGERFANKPLIIPTVYKTIVFSLFAMVFSVFEHFITGLFVGRDMGDLYQELMSKGIDQILASALILFFVFILFFAFIELSRVLGENKLFTLFFKRRESDAK